MEEPEESIGQWLGVELSHGKYSKDNSWGREVVRAIDLDDCLLLYSTLRKGPEGAVNTQVTALGYAQYLWTSGVHRFLGDTAMHLALRQRKLMCAHMLLILKADTRIPNKVGETAERMVSGLYGTTVDSMKWEAHKFIADRLDLKDAHRLPDVPRYRKVEEEAWMLMREGRLLYSEVPKSFFEDRALLDKRLAGLRKRHLSFNMRHVQEEVGDGAQGGVGVGVGNGGGGAWARLESRSGLAPEGESVGTGGTGDAGDSDSESDATDASSATGGSSRGGSRDKRGAKPVGKTGVKSPAKSSTKLPAKPSAKSAKGVKAPKSKGSISQDEDSDSSAGSSRTSRKGGKAKVKSQKQGQEKERAERSARAAVRLAEMRERKPVGAKGAAYMLTGQAEDLTPLRAQYEAVGVQLRGLAELEALGEEQRLLIEEIQGQGALSLQAAEVAAKERRLKSIGGEIRTKTQALFVSTRQLREEERGISMHPGPRFVEEWGGEGGGGGTSPGSSPGRPRGAGFGGGSPGRLRAAHRPSDLAMGDVWGRDGVADVVRLVQRQQRLNVEELRVQSRHISRGLSLLDAVVISNPADRIMRHEQKVRSTHQQYIPEGMKDLQGLKKLKFLNMSRLTRAPASALITPSAPARLAQSLADKLLLEQAEQGQGQGQWNGGTTTSHSPGRGGSPGSIDSSVGFARASELDGGSLNTLSSLNSALSADSHRSRVLDSLQRRHTEREESAFPLERRITVLSTRTNMKYMLVGDRGAQDLARVLRDEGHVREVCFAGARITCLGLVHFASAMPDMAALRRLDLSNNSISDEGAFALAEALPFCAMLESVSLLGNRVRVRGAARLVEATFESQLLHLNLQRNQVKREDRELLEKLMEERNYSADARGIFTSTERVVQRSEGSSSMLHAQAMTAKTIVL